MARPLTDGDLLSIPQVQRLVPIGKSSLYALVASGELPSYRVRIAGGGRGRVFVARADLEAFIEGARQTATRQPVRVDVDVIRDRIRRRGA